MRKGEAIPMKIRNIPFGYRIENGTIHLHPTESQVVREIHAAYLDGQSLLQIAASLNERGVEYMPGAAAWNKARLKRIIEDVRYLGNETYPAIENTYSSFDVIGKDDRCFQQVATVMVGHVMQYFP